MFFSHRVLKGAEFFFDLAPCAQCLDLFEPSALSFPDFSLELLLLSPSQPPSSPEFNL
jgi:hypothetical protein